MKSLDFTHIGIIKSKINISGSKSESNRALILQKLFPNIEINNLSDSDDTIYLKNALNSDNELINIGHAGTAMRFLTAYFATQEGKNVVITGSERMQERPVKILVDALRMLGSEINYLKNEGYPPLKITGKKIVKNKVSLAANVSSQYISALLLIAPSLENGLELTLEGNLTSLPYIEMTLDLVRQTGVKATFDKNVISVSKRQSQNIKNTENQRIKLDIESDWSSASYYYSLIALSEIGSEITLSHFKKQSLQGDSILSKIYEHLGVETTFSGYTIILKKVRIHKPVPFGNSWDGTSSPDIAQTLAVTCLGLDINVHFTGLHTLKIKETDRLAAIKTEMEKLGAKIEITDSTLTLHCPEKLIKNVSIGTYNDHRMAMAFAPLALKVPLQIENPDVVTKSYKDFWKDFEKITFIQTS